MRVVYVRETDMLYTTPNALREKHADDLIILVGNAVARMFGLDFLPYSIATMPTGNPVAVIPRRHDLARVTYTISELEELVRAAKEVAA